MNNVKTTIDKHILTIEVDLTKDFGPSASGGDPAHDPMNVPPPVSSSISAVSSSWFELIVIT